VVRREKAEARQQLLFGLEDVSIRKAAALTGIPRSTVHRLSREPFSLDRGVSHEPLSG
jgi:DNA-directed RNA polymerase specialized sigma24 family protein